jgi:peptidoglycan/LPS O-acetylase OafA/YrhL
LLHTIIGSALVKVAKDDAFTSPKRIAVVLVAAIVSIVASLLYFKFVEKPSISLSKKLTGKS